MADEEEFLMDSDTSQEDEENDGGVCVVMHRHPEEAKGATFEENDSDSSDFDPIGFGIEERIRHAQPLDDVSDEDEEDEEDIEDDDEDIEDDMVVPAGAYIAESFKDLHVSPEVRELFQYIEEYKPIHLDLEASK